MDKPRCRIEGCERDVYAKLLCETHYRVDLESRPGYQELHPCSVGGCNRVARSLGMCQLHYVRQKKFGNTDPRPRAPARRPYGPREGSVGAIDPTPDTRPGHGGYLAVNVVNDIKQKALVIGYGPGKYSRKERRAMGWWRLTAEQAYRLIVADCFYCGIASGWPEKRNGIDRKDSAVGYTVENCVTACWRCNAAKNDSNLAEFREWALRIAARLEQWK